MAVINRIAGFSEEMTAWRRHLHAHPELGFDCHQTAAFVVERLREFGITQIETGVATSGVVAVIEGRGWAHDWSARRYGCAADDRDHRA